MADMSDRDRIVKLEVHQEHQAELNDELLNRLGSIDGKMDSLVEQSARMKGFVGGVIFTVSSIGAVIGAAITALWNHFSTR